MFAFFSLFLQGEAGLPGPPGPVGLPVSLFLLQQTQISLEL